MGGWGGGEGGWMGGRRGAASRRVGWMDKREISKFNLLPSSFCLFLCPPWRGMVTAVDGCRGGAASGRVGGEGQTCYQWEPGPHQAV